MAELTIDTGAILQNYKRYAEGGKVIPVLKANACGLGLLQTAVLLRGWGVELVACSTEEEALRLSASGNLRVLLLACVHDSASLRGLLRQNVILAVESLEQAKLIDSLELPAKVHLAVDTGFGRFGFRFWETEEMKAVFSLQNVQVCGIFSHFACANAAPKQFERFQSVLAALEGYDVGLRHIAATGTALNEAYRLDAVRIGTGLTGRVADLTPAAKLTARVLSIKEFKKGDSVGYDQTRLRRDTRVAILEVGTADGAFLSRYSGVRAFLRSRRRFVEIHGAKAPVLASPGLTHTEVDVTDFPCAVGDLAVVEQTPVLVPSSVPRRYI